MAFESVSDAQIAELLSCPKRVSNPQARTVSKGAHEQVNYKVSATDGSGHRFEVYQRQNLRTGMESDFSCGIRWLAPNGESLTLRRYNGSSHPHKNHVENEEIDETFHIHLATERYIKADRKAEGFAEETNRYQTVDGALHCLAADCKLSGISTTADEPRLFEWIENHED